MIWPIKKLGEVVEELDFKKAPIDSWPYIEIGDIHIENKAIIFKDKKSIKGAVIAPADSVLVSRVRPTRGAITLIDKDYSVSSAFTVLKAKTSETSSKFLFYWLGHSRDFLVYLQRKQKGSNYPSVREKDVLNFELSIPPFSVQRKIVERLDTIKKAQELNDKQITLADELFQSLLRQELDQKGKNWEEKKLGEICDVRDGTHESPKFHPTGIPLVTSKNLVGGHIDFKNINYISLKDHKEIDKRSKVDDGDVLFGMIGTIGNPVVVKKDREFSIKNVGLVKFIKSSPIDYFIYYSLLGHFIQKQIRIFSRGGTQKFISLGNLRNLKILVPNRITQQKIIEKLSTVQDYKEKLLEQKEKLQELFELTLDKGFKGELVK